MNICGRLQRRDTSAARDCDVYAIRDGICQALVGEGGNEAERTLRDPVGDFEKVVVGRRGIGPSIQLAAELFQTPLIAVAALRGESSGYRLRVGEDWR